MAENNKDLQPDTSPVDTTNIFEEFVDDKELNKEIKQSDIKQKRDKQYYMLKASIFFKYGFLLLLFVLVILQSYIFLQNKKDIQEMSFLEPICFIFLGEISENEDCASIAYIHDKYTSDFNTLEQQQYSKLSSIIERLYQVENFDKTKEVKFLLDKSNNKLPILDILSEFDNLKNEYDPIDKGNIVCSDIIINKLVIHITCEAYTAGYRKSIIWYAWNSETSVDGTSLSLANSFINYIELQSKDFEVIDRQRKFTSQKITDQETNFTNKTPFTLALKYHHD